MKRDHRNEKLDNVFDACLERVLGGESVERCLADYPDLASELAPLLETALTLKYSIELTPGEGFRARARFEFQRTLAEARSKKPRLFAGFLPRWAAVLSIIIAVLILTSGTVAAAGSSMPDSPLYPVKLATEQVRLMLLVSPESRAATYADFTDKRVAEIIHMANKGNRQKVATLTKRLDRHLVTLAALTQVASAPGVSGEKSQLPALTPAPGVAAPGATSVADTFKAGSGMMGGRRSPQSRLRAKIAVYAVNHPAELKKALEKAPPSVRLELVRAISIAASGYERALKTLD